jgi:hypothetical protein
MPHRCVGGRLCNDADEVQLGVARGREAARSQQLYSSSTKSKRVACSVVENKETRV